MTPNNIDLSKALVIDLPLITFDEEGGVFTISQNDISWEEYEQIYVLVERLRWSNPSIVGPDVKVSEIETDYHDRCLGRYHYQRFIEGRAHENTCWISINVNTIPIGKIEQGKLFSINDKIALIKNLPGNGLDKLFREQSQCIKRALDVAPKELLDCVSCSNEGWVTLKYDDLEKFLPWPRKIRYKSIRSWEKFRGRNYERILDVVDSIEQQGWKPELASSIPSAVLGYSTKTKRYISLTGRHRFSAVTYLYGQGKISGDTVINYPTIRYSWRRWHHGVPNQVEQLCSECKYL